MLSFGLTGLVTCVVKAEEEKRAIIRPNYPQYNQISFIKVSVKLDWFGIFGFLLTQMTFLACVIMTKHSSPNLFMA